MFWIIETQEQLEKFRTKGYEEVYLEIIPCSPKLHPVVNSISLIYIHPIYLNRGYLLCVEHSESLSLDLEEVYKTIKGIKKIHVLDKKETLHYIIHENLNDITFNNKPKNNPLTQAHEFFYKNNSIEDVNKIIPLPKHYEFCKNNFELYKEYINNPINEFFNNKVSLVFNAIERIGIYVDIALYTRDFYKITEPCAYTIYNIKTHTTRPSNTFNGVNYMALNKKDGSRKAFIPRNNYLMEIDIKSYHPALIAKLIGYDFGNKTPHEYLAELYGVDHQEAKLITFRQIYGGIYDEYKELPFFKKTQEYIDDLWIQFTTEGYIEVPISKHRFYHKDNSDTKPQTLFNYYLQALETALSVLIMWDVLKILQNKKTKLVLYVYDSILLDVSEDEEYLLKDIAEIYKRYNLKVGIKIGSDYSFE